jgi:hypothetical protein
MLTVVVVLKALLEIAALALLGQGLLFILAGAKRSDNVFYRVLSTMTAPILKPVRFITPRFIVDQHIGALAFLILVVFWFMLLLQIQGLCLDGGLRNPTCGRLAAEYVARCEGGNGEACQALERNGIFPAPLN